MLSVILVFITKISIKEYETKRWKYDKSKKTYMLKEMENTIKKKRKYKTNEKYKSIRHKEGKEERNHHHQSCFNALWSILILCK